MWDKKLGDTHNGTFGVEALHIRYLVLVEDVKKVRGPELLGPLLAPPDQHLFQGGTLVTGELPANRNRQRKATKKREQTAPYTQRRSKDQDGKQKKQTVGILT